MRAPGLTLGFHGFRVADIFKVVLSSFNIKCPMLPVALDCPFLIVCSIY